MPTLVHTFSLCCIASALFPSLVLAQTCPQTWSCPEVDFQPTLDAELTEWTDIPSFTSSLRKLTGDEYTIGNAEYKCLHDGNDIYFFLSIPGDYSFNATDNSVCAAIGFMTKVGVQATFYGMGNCPDAMTGCPDGVPDTCDEYRVDLGAHWELAGLEQGVEYGVNNGTGNDLVANKDDEYSVSAFCRFDDDDANAANEWSGAWKHTNPVDGGNGTYMFEMKRSLTTASSLTDAQMSPGGTYQFGVAFWDPYETEAGWTDSGHYLTGCGKDWIELELGGTAPETTAPAPAPSSSVTLSTSFVAGFVALVGSLAW